MANDKKYSISQNIKKYRVLNKMTQEKLAELLDLDTQYYAQLERGERNFTIEKITRVCTIFRIGVEDIIELESSENKNEDQELVERLKDSIQNLPTNQLFMLEKFIDEILPFVK